MASFGERSRERMLGVHIDLCRVAEEVVKLYDCTVPYNGGHRTRQVQDDLYPAFTQKQWPHSYHNCSVEGSVEGIEEDGFISMPLSLGLDLVPYNKTKPHIDWKDRDGFYHFAGYVRAVANAMDIPIIWGGDWDGDYDLDDQEFYDFGHYQLDIHNNSTYARLWQEHLNAYG